MGLELRLTNVSLIVLHVPFPFIIPFWKKSTSFWHIDFPPHRRLTFSIYALLIQLWGHSINFSCSASFNKYQFQPVLNYSFVWNKGINLLCLVEIWWVPFAGPPVLQRLWICCVKKLQTKSILGQWCWGDPLSESGAKFVLLMFLISCCTHFIPGRVVIILAVVCMLF